jgi:hypothetical protein
VVDDEAMGSFAGLMFVIGISLLVSSPIAWVMERILAASARTDPVFERQRVVAERMVVPMLLAGLIALAVWGVALLLSVATD